MGEVYRAWYPICGVSLTKGRDDGVIREMLTKERISKIGKALELSCQYLTCKWNKIKKSVKSLA